MEISLYPSPRRLEMETRENDIKAKIKMVFFVIISFAALC